MSFTEPHVIEDHAEILPRGSVLSSFQQVRDRLAAEHEDEKRLDVPSWKGALRVVYRYPDGDADPIVRALERATTAAKYLEKLNANADLLIACVADIEFRQDPGGPFAPLDDAGPSRFNPRLAEKMGLELPDGLKSPARFICRHLFSPRAAVTGKFSGDLSLMRQAATILTWLDQGDERADEELRGE